MVVLQMHSQHEGAEGGDVDDVIGQLSLVLSHPKELCDVVSKVCAHIPEDHSLYDEVTDTKAKLE